MKYLNGIAATVCLSLTALSASGDRSEAATVLTLAIDGSGSIGSSDFALQRDAYSSQLGNIEIDGSVAIGVYQFASSVVSEFSLQLIDSLAARDSLVAAIDAMTQIGSATNIAGSITTAASAMNALFDCGGADSCLIDVSTDGQGNIGDEDLAAGNAVLAGIAQVNCLGVGGGADCGFIAGTDSFSITATTFSDFESALATKLSREGVIDDPVGGVVPLPASGLLLLAGFGVLARFRPRSA